MTVPAKFIITVDPDTVDSSDDTHSNRTMELSQKSITCVTGRLQYLFSISRTFPKTALREPDPLENPLSVGQTVSVERKKTLAQISFRKKHYQFYLNQYRTLISTFF
jgi:hypothetical protein